MALKLLDDAKHDHKISVRQLRRLEVLFKGVPVIVLSHSLTGYNFRNARGNITRNRQHGIIIVP
jgi:hypothetical protein